MALVHRRGWASTAYVESVWFAGLAPHWAAFAGLSAFPTPAQLSAVYAARVAALESLASTARALQFVDAPAKKKKRPAGEVIAMSSLYEGSIVEQKSVPTRLDDWHDFFNALTFIAFPRAKWALHARQYRLWQQRIGPDTTRLPGARTREQDALTLFDEGGALLLLEQGERYDVDAAASDLHALQLLHAGRAQLLPFGHALAEHLVEGLACPLATLYPLTMDFADAGSLDSRALDVIDHALASAIERPENFRAPSRARGVALSELSAYAAQNSANRA